MFLHQSQQAGPCLCFLATLRESGGGKASEGLGTLSTTAYAVFAVEQKRQLEYFANSSSPPNLSQQGWVWISCISRHCCCRKAHSHSLPNLYQTLEVPKVKTQPGHLINNAVSSPIYIYNHKADPHFLKQHQLSRCKALISIWVTGKRGEEGGKCDQRHNFTASHT